MAGRRVHQSDFSRCCSPWAAATLRLSPHSLHTHTLPGPPAHVLSSSQELAEACGHGRACSLHLKEDQRGQAATLRAHSTGAERRCGGLPFAAGFAPGAQLSFLDMTTSVFQRQTPTLPGDRILQIPLPPGSLLGFLQPQRPCPDLRGDLTGWTTSRTCPELAKAWDVPRCV